MRRTLTEKSCIVFDLETTGLNPRRGHRVIEIGAVRLQGGVIIGSFQKLIKIAITIPVAITAITGITDEMLHNQSGPETVFLMFRDFIGRDPLIAHNAAFDTAFLRKEFRRQNIAFENRIICTMKMSKQRYPALPDYKLESVARHLLGLLPEGIRRHRALDDAKLAAMVWIALNGGVVM